MDVDLAEGKSLIIDDLLSTCLDALGAAQHLVVEVRKGVTQMVLRGGRLDADLLNEHQFAAHGYAWLSTYVSAMQQMLAWAERLEAEGALSEVETLMLQATFGEYLSQIAGERSRPGSSGCRPGRDRSPAQHGRE